MKKLWVLMAVGLAVALSPGVAWADGGGASFDSLMKQGWLWAYLGVFAAGVFTSLTPCVYPMIPIVVGIFGARESTSKVRAFGLATMYVLGMGVMYSTLGVLVAMSGKAFGTILGNPWVVIPLVVFYALLAASMFGFFEINLPAGLQSRLSRVGGKGFGGAFLMGLVGGLTAAPCTGPMLGGLLAFVATTRNAPLGFSLLFTYAIGMGVLFWVIATFAVSLPKSGRWMEWVKSIGGIALLVVGVYFLRPIWPALREATNPSLVFLIVAGVLAVVGLVAGAVHLSFHGTRVEKGRKAGAILLVIAGTTGVLNWIATPTLTLPWRYDEEIAIAEAVQGARPVMVDFGAEWCEPCKKLETDVFAHPSIHQELTGRFTTVKVDVTHDNALTQAVKDRYKMDDLLPTVILLGPDGKERRRFEGELPAVDEFLTAVRAIR
jgi:thioredoxin:protein disulfide reductase